jgi:hypothetical protein
MDNKVKMMTIREIAKTGILPEHALRVLVKKGAIPHLLVGNKVLINYYILEEILFVNYIKAM